MLFPLSYYDGDWYTEEQVSSRFGCIWHGESQSQIEKLELQFLEDLKKDKYEIMYFNVNQNICYVMFINTN